MANTKFLDAGGDAAFVEDNTANCGFYSSASSSGVATDFVHGNHIKSMTFTIGGGNVQTPTGVLGDAGRRISFYMYLVALPTGGNTAIVDFWDATTAGIIVLNLTTAGTLKLFAASGSQIGSTSSALSTGQWYRISIAYTITDTTHNRFEIFINGVSAISGTNGTLARVSSSILVLGNIGGDANLDLRMSDIYVDDSSALTDTGNIWVTAKRPNANGSANAFTTRIGAGGSGYGSGHSPQVNERPASVTNGWSLSNTTVATEEYTIEGASVGDINITGATIVDYGGWINAQVNSTANSPVHHIIVGGTSTAITMTTSAKVFTAFKGSTTYPAGNTDIGMDAQYTTTPHLTSLFECGIQVAYIPALSSSMFLELF